MEDENHINSDEVQQHDQRVFERFRVSFTAHIRLSDGNVAHAHAVDISLGGIYLEYGAPADEGKEFEVAFDLPFVNDFKRVFARAKVVRVVVIGNRNMYGLAFVFTDFVKDSRGVLEKYIQLRKLQTG